MKKIGAIVGSPRKGGNTDILIDEVLKGGHYSGAETKKIYLYDYDIKPCTACNGCIKNNGKCIVNDDLQQIIEAVSEYEILVLGTPVYWWGPTAQFKIFMDKWYSPQAREMLKDKKVILVIPLQDDNLDTARHTEGMLRDAFEYIGTEILDIIISKDTDGKGDVKRHQEIMRKAYSAGKNSVK
jgi:multimeric flavodoxin WrbA